MDDPPRGFMSSRATFWALTSTLVFFKDSEAVLYFILRSSDGGQDARSGDGT
jgi:hypothetical protein